MVLQNDEVMKLLKRFREVAEGEQSREMAMNCCRGAATV